MTKHNVAVFTFCNNNGPVNYGQILQSYAVHVILEELGCESKVVLYQKLKVMELMTKRVNRFHDFVHEYIPTTKPCLTNEELEEEISDCDVLLSGSDQVWFPYTVDNVWTLGIGKKEAMRISFAASGIFYDDEFTNEKIKENKDNFDKFDYISVREGSAIPILSKYTDKDVHLCPDPTLFVGRELWDSIARSEPTEEYIFCYCLGGVRPYDLIFKKLSKLYGNIKIKYIVSNLEEDYCYSNMEPVYDAGPAEFVGLIKGAKAIITDSFHGVTMSIIYEKDWYNLERLSIDKDRFGGRTRVGSILEYIPGDCGWIRNTRDLEKRYEFLKSIDYKNLFIEVNLKKEELAKVLS